MRGALDDHYFEFMTEAQWEYSFLVNNWLSHLSEGIRLYVSERSGFREGCSDDEDWQLVQAFCAKDVKLSHQLRHPPSWAQALYLNFQNISVWRAIYGGFQFEKPRDYEEHVGVIKKHAVDLLSTSTGPSSDEGSMPLELRSAIDAWRAVRSSGNAGVGRSVKQQLDAWLREFCPTLSESARERVSTVANWQQSGGAPKTR